MSVNFEVKGMLARLLATENLVIEHKNVETACFDVHRRVLTLPMWEKASSTVYDMLCAHEVSHALYTPDEDWSKQTKVPQQFVNVVEDARVEKLIKRRYMGLAKTFFGAYKELQEQDFFMLEGEDLSKMNLADKANLYFKVGNFIQLSFNEKEKEIIDLISDAETFGDVLHASQVLYEFCVDKQREEVKIPSFDSPEKSSDGSSSNENSEKSEGNELESDDESDSDSDNGSSEGNVDSNSVEPNGGTQTEPEVKTMSSLNDKIKELASNSSLQETIYIKVPKVNLESVIVSSKEIHDTFSEYWNSSEPELFEQVDKNYKEFKTSAQKEVNYLVKEFECRKSADSYARATVSRTGVLDTAKLHTYRYNEDLFKKVTTLADGKNHGLVFILDWSGSMSEVMLDTIKQLYNLIWFCKKVSIPFEVYAFTNSYGVVINYDKNGNPSPPVEHTVKKENEFYIDVNFRLMNILSSKSRNIDLDNHMKNIFRTCNYFSSSYYNVTYSIPNRLHLSGTPLNEALVALHEILPKFKKENKLQKVQCVILTDGEAGPLAYNVKIDRNNGHSYLGVRSVNDKCFLRDSQTGYVYSMRMNRNAYIEFTQLILRNLRDKFPEINFIGMRILENYGASNFIREHCLDNKIYDEVMKTWKKDRNFSIETVGYHKYFGISGNSLNKDTQFNVNEDASKAKIKSAFAKSLGVKKMNKKILNEFICLIA